MTRATRANYTIDEINARRQRMSFELECAGGQLEKAFYGDQR